MCKILKAENLMSVTKLSHLTLPEMLNKGLLTEIFIISIPMQFSIKLNNSTFLIHYLLGLDYVAHPTIRVPVNKLLDILY